MRKNNQKITIIGFILVIVILYVVYSHYGTFYLTGSVIRTDQKTNVEIGGPKNIVKTDVRILDVMDQGIRNKGGNSEILVENIDTESGDVTVILHCMNGEVIGELTKIIPPGETVSFVFKNSGSCDKKYIVEPGLITIDVTK